MNKQLLLRCASVLCAIAFIALVLLIVGVGIAMAQTGMTVPDQATWLAVLTMLGLGQYAASIIAVVGLLGFILVHVMPWIPAPAATAPAWRKALYSLLSYLAGNYFHASNTKA